MANSEPRVLVSIAILWKWLQVLWLIRESRWTHAMSRDEFRAPSKTPKMPVSGLEEVHSVIIVPAAGAVAREVILVPPRLPSETVQSASTAGSLYVPEMQR